jgi:hypothetical protein
LRDQEIADLKETVLRLGAQIEAIQSMDPEKRGPGRPRKEAA